MTGKYLINTDNWFIAPDGKTYKAVWGNVEILTDDVLGVKTNRNASNWYAKVGNEKNHVIIAGCQIHYAVKCEERPFTEFSEDWNNEQDKVHVIQTPSKIYIVE